MQSTIKQLVEVSMNQNVVYQKLVLKGTHYDIGKQSGAILYEHNKPYVEWLTSPLELPNKTKIPELTLEKAEKRCNYLNQIDPGLGDEVRGLADGLQVPLNHLHKLLLNGMGIEKPCACSVFGIDRCLTDNGHAYIGQSYEYSFEDEFSYIVEQAEGSYSHMGFSLFHIGRFDGINEKGLCIGITSLDFVNPSIGEKEGLSFALLVRIMLDTCSTTSEALNKLNSLPICTNANIIVGDKSGNIVLAEIQTVDGKSDIIERNLSPYVYGFNHFLGEKHKQRLPQKRYFSYAREQFMEQYLHGITTRNEALTKNDLQKLLTDKIPNGLCCHAYSDYFGTLRSMIYDVTDSTVSIAFGSPQSVEYISMSLAKELESETGCELIEVEYNDEPEDMPFWVFVE